MLVDQTRLGRSYNAQPAGREIESGRDDELEQSSPAEKADYVDEYEDGPWYLGKARDEFNRRRRGQDVGQLGQEDDPVQVICLRSVSVAADIMSTSGHDREDMLKMIGMVISVPKTTSRELRADGMVPTK